jgi:hypothetical protein
MYIYIYLKFFYSQNILIIIIIANF